VSWFSDCALAQLPPKPSVSEWITVKTSLDSQLASGRWENWPPLSCEPIPTINLFLQTLLGPTGSDSLENPNTQMFSDLPCTGGNAVLGQSSLFTGLNLDSKCLLKCCALPAYLASPAWRRRNNCKPYASLWGLSTLVAEDSWPSATLCSGLTVT
jgi:hypothetical protein